MNKQLTEWFNKCYEIWPNHKRKRGRDSAKFEIKIKDVENGVLISESFTGTCYPPNTDVATLHSEVAAIANVVWTQSVKDAYAAAFPIQPMP